MPLAKRRDAFAAYMDHQPGRGLETARLIPLEALELNPRQARQVFDEDALAELTASVRQHGVLQPIGVLVVGESYRILWGERRYRAAAAAGLAEVPAIVYEGLSEADAAILTALENLQREDLDPEDEARQFVMLLEQTGLSQRALAAQLGVDHTYLSRRVKMLEERPDLFALVRSEALTWRRALELLHGATPAEDGTVLHGATPAERTPRAEMPKPGAPGWRALEAAYRPLKRIRPEAIPPTERIEWLNQLEDLRTYVTELIVAIDAEVAREP